MFFVIWGEHAILSWIAQREMTLDYFKGFFFFFLFPSPLHYHSPSSMEPSHNIYLIISDKRSDAVVAAAVGCRQSILPLMMTLPLILAVVYPEGGVRCCS